MTPAQVLARLPEQDERYKLGKEGLKEIRKIICMELSEHQRVVLETIVHQVSSDLFVESVTLDAQQSLELVLCREFVCYRPLHITQDLVDCTAALNGDPVAQQALKTYLSATLGGL